MCRLFDCASLIAGMADSGEVRTALDIGCGHRSPLAGLRPRVFAVGIDAFPPAIEKARAAGLFDDYICGDVMSLAPDAVLSSFGGKKPDAVLILDLIEHLPKAMGFELLARCQDLCGKYVLVQTPNGFLEQGPEYGNEHQRHLSGWFAHDFEGLGYSVCGALGMKCLHGYAGNFKWKLPGIQRLDRVMARALCIARRPSLAFSLIAFKDVRGVSTRIAPDIRENEIKDPNP
jgi:hypothetical protein